MSHPNPERDERVRQIRERRFRRGRSTDAGLNVSRTEKEDIDYLLSLLDSQAVLARELAIIVDVATDEDPGTSLSKLHKIQHAAATHMRDRCLSEVKEYWQRIQGEDDEGMRELLFGALVVKLENLTLEGDNSRTKPQVDAVATRMRDRCVAKLKSVARTHREMAEKFKGKEMGELQAIRAEECDTLVGILQSLTLEETETR